MKCAKNRVIEEALRTDIRTDGRGDYPQEMRGRIKNSLVKAFRYFKISSIQRGMDDATSSWGKAAQAITMGRPGADATARRDSKRIK